MPDSPSLTRRPRKPEDPAMRLPPHSVEAEQGVLGCLMLDPGDGTPKAEVALQPDAFYDLRHRTVYETLLELHREGVPADLVTLPQRLRDKSQLDGVGGLAYLTECVGAVPSSANLGYYVDIVAQKWTLRRLILACTASAAAAYEGDRDAEEVVDDAEKAVLAVRLGKVSPPQTAREVVIKAINVIEGWHQRKGALCGIPTGLIDLDQMTDGLQPQEMTVLCGYPGSGKSALAMNAAVHAAETGDCPVLVFSLEMSCESLAVRMLCSEARVNAHHARRGHMADRDFPALTRAAGKLSSLPIVFEGLGQESVYTLRSRARTVCRELRPKLVVIDYLQLMNATGSARRLTSRQEELDDISKNCKAMSRELNTHVMLLSQLNDDGKLKGSRAAGEDADNLWRLTAKRPEDGDDPSDACPVLLEINKQRNGPTGIVNLTFLKSFTRFECAAKVNAEDMQ